MWWSMRCPLPEIAPMEYSQRDYLFARSFGDITEPINE